MDKDHIVKAEKPVSQQTLHIVAKTRLLLQSLPSLSNSPHLLSYRHPTTPEVFPQPLPLHSAQRLKTRSLRRTLLVVGLLNFKLPTMISPE